MKSQTENCHDILILVLVFSIHFNFLIIRLIIISGFVFHFNKFLTIASWKVLGRRESAIQNKVNYKIQDTQFDAR